MNKKNKYTLRWFNKDILNVEIIYGTAEMISRKRQLKLKGYKVTIKKEQV